MSQIFEPFRALGFVCDGTPFALQQRGADAFVTVVLGRSYQLYNCAKLNLLFVGPLLPRRIRAIAQWKDTTFCAVGADVVAFDRGREVGALRGGQGDGEEGGGGARVTQLLPFGEHLLCLAEDGGLALWTLKGFERTAHWRLPAALREPSALCHPPTYLNKVLIAGGESGAMQLWNLNTQKCVHAYTDWGSRVTCIAVSPAVDVVGIGLADGRIAVHDVRQDLTVVSFSHDAPITSLSFRSDGAALLASGDELGCVAFWDLSLRRLSSMQRRAHEGAVTSLGFLPGQPLLLSASPDNSLKTWIFDTPDGGCRLLRSRSGHSSPPTRVRHHGESGRQLLTGGLDRSMYAVSTTSDRQTTEMSQGRAAKKARKNAAATRDVRAGDGRRQDEHAKLAPLRDVAVCSAKEGRWASVLSCHAGDPSAYTWEASKKAIGAHKLTVPLGGGAGGAGGGAAVVPTVSCVCISPCGSYGLLGSSNGRVDKFNLQSGQHRGQFGAPHSTANASKGKKKQRAAAAAAAKAASHMGAVHGVVCDATNVSAVSGGFDGLLKWWDFSSGQLQETVQLGSAVTQLLLHRDNAILAVSCDDLSIRCFDLDTRRMVRSFVGGHTNRVSDMCFSADGRWLLSAGMDCTVRVWDIPSGRCVDWWATTKPITSMSFSPTGDFLATTHAERVGVYLWSNRTQYTTAILRNVPAKPALADLPTPSGEGARVEEADENEDEEGEEGGEEELDWSKRRQLSPFLLTLSDVPRSQWTILPHLQMVKERNKPKEPPKKPELAPFFLESMPGLASSNNPQFVKRSAGEGEGKGGEAAAPRSRILNLGREGARGQETELVLALRAADARGDFAEVMVLMASLPPSGVDLAITELSTPGVENLEVLGLALRWFEWCLRSKRDFEVTQAYLALFLQLHADALAAEPALLLRAEAVRDAQAEAWGQLGGLIQQAACLVSFLGGFKDLQ